MRSVAFPTSGTIPAGVTGTREKIGTVAMSTSMVNTSSGSGG